MYARLDEENRVAELVRDNPAGRYHPDLIWQEIPAALEPWIDNKFWWDGEAFYTEPEEYFLNKVKSVRRSDFTLALATLDNLCARPAQYISLAMVTEEPAPADDIDRLWQYEEFKAENRKLMAQLNAATTWEEAEAIKPWMPWEGMRRLTSAYAEAEKQGNQNSQQTAGAE